MDIQGKKQISFLRKEREEKNPSFYVIKKNILFENLLDLSSWDILCKQPDPFPCTVKTSSS